MFLWISAERPLLIHKKLLLLRLKTTQQGELFFRFFSHMGSTTSL